MYQPIVIFGGYFSFPTVYRSMGDYLSCLTGQPVRIVDANGDDWVRGTNGASWTILLRKLDRTVRMAAATSPTGKVTLIGHSLGGVLARLYLSPIPFHGVTYNGLERIDHLITMGSPHCFKDGDVRGSGMSRWVEDHYPGTAFSPQVKYTSLAGKWLHGTQFGPLLSRITYNFYNSVSGNGTVIGDGFVPVENAILGDSEAIILDGVTHFWVIGEPWYGNKEIIPIWFPTIEEAATSCQARIGA